MSFSSGRAGDFNVGELVWNVTHFPLASMVGLTGLSLDGKGNPEQQLKRAMEKFMLKASESSAQTHGEQGASSPKLERLIYQCLLTPGVTRAQFQQHCLAALNRSPLKKTAINDVLRLRRTLRTLEGLRFACAGSDAFTAALAPVLRRLVDAIRQDSRFFARGYTFTRDRVFQVLDGLSGTQKGLSLIYDSVSALLRMRAEDYASPAFADGRRFLEESLARYLSLLALDPRNSQAVNAALSRYVERFLLTPQSMPVYQNEWLRSLAVRAGQGHLNLISATGQDKRETLLLKACLAYFPALSDVIPPRLLQKILGQLPSLAAFSAHDRAYLHFLQQITFPFELVFRAPRDAYND